AQVRDHAVARADDGHRLGGREETILVERLVRRQLMALAEEAFQVLLRDVAVPRRDIYHQPRGRPAVSRGLAPEGLAHQAFHQRAVHGDSAHAWPLFAGTPSTDLPARINWMPDASINSRCSGDRLLSTINTSMAENSHKNAKDCRPILVWSAT